MSTVIPILCLAATVYFCFHFAGMYGLPLAPLVCSVACQLLLPLTDMALFQTMLVESVKWLILMIRFANALTNSMLLATPQPLLEKALLLDQLALSVSLFLVLISKES